MNNRILVCDDDEGILDVISLTLDSSGFEVIRQQQSVRVLDDIKKYSPRLVILDLWMPHVSGDVLTKELKQNAETRDIIVLIISASYDGRMIAKDAHADGFMEKPFSIHELLHVVKSFFPQ